MWDRGLHSYKMVNATLFQSCHYLGRLPANVNFEVEQVLDDGSYLSWIYPDGKSRKKGGQKIQVRVSFLMNHLGLLYLAIIFFQFKIIFC